ncbi:MAG TPA: hypothetical protein ENJ03_04245 [Candidatus Desulfofervidus auxilii]|uniref:2-oxoacid:ferredoxin oxidoreductase subunit beta n=1 Tax=Desulfofervidus auxilii TaxID=1621989 RepID=A0A7V1I4R3_DESA2|nr:hypothetical protein [Candidatus Desulfofervidus auxilii]
MGKKHPLEVLTREERLPHILCTGCGIGTTMANLAEALMEEEAELDLDKVSIVSGIGCAGRAAGYFKLDGFHTTHGRPVAFATGLKLANPDLHVIVFSGDGDLAAIGGNHLIHAARRNIDIKVICINNFTYGMTGGQMGPTTPLGTWSSTSVYGNYEMPFNLPYLMEACGATYVARWTSAHAHYIKNSIREAMHRKGFCFIEVISACPVNWGRRNKLRTGKAMVKFFLDHTVVKTHPNSAEALIQMDTPIVCGVFVDKTLPSYLDVMQEQLSKKLGISVFRGDGKVELPEDKKETKTKTKPATKRLRPVQIKIAGLGGQGIGLLGLILGRAACIFDGKQAIYTQEYGPEARGGASSSNIIISSELINIPYVTKPDVMITMAQGAFRKYKKEIQPNSILFMDKDLVKPTALPKGVKVYAVPATRMAEQLGRAVVANIVMLGFFVALTPYISLEAAEKALNMSVPKGTEEFNLKAFKNGYDYGKRIKKEGE